MSSTDSKHSSQFVSDVALAFGSELHRFLGRRLRRSEDAADIAQEVYLRLLRLPRTDLIRKPHAYVYYVASQIAAEHRMRERHEPLAFDTEALDRRADESLHARPEIAAEGADIEQRLRRLLGKLPTMHRNVLVLAKRDGFSNKEIARALNLSEHTVKKYLFQAVARLAVHKEPG